MKFRSKYTGLYNHLRQCGKDQITLTFTQIERLMGSELPESARQSRAFWSNRSKGALQATAWMSAGYHIKDVDLEQSRVTFRRPMLKYTSSVPGWYYFVDGRAR